MFSFCWLGVLFLEFVHKWKYGTLLEVNLTWKSLEITQGYDNVERNMEVCTKFHENQSNTLTKAKNVNLLVA